MQRENAYSVLLVSANDKFNQSLTSFMSKEEYDPVIISSSVSSARRQFRERDFDIVIINTPLKDEHGVDLAIDIADDSSCGVMLLVKNEIFDIVCDKVQDRGVFTLPRPVTVQMMTHALKMLGSTRARLLRREQKQKSFEERINEIKSVNRAKLLLIEKEKLTEEEAHRFIEKSAMNDRVSKADIAAMIIKKYT